MSVIEVADLHKNYTTARGDDFVALQDINIQFSENTFTCLVGPSGCGKSTLLKIMAGLEKPSLGQVAYRGQIMDKPSGKIGMVFQEYSLFPWLNVLDNIGVGPFFSGVGKKERYATSQKYLEMIGMEDFATALPHELSGGMRQRVAIARALANEPDVLLMDEPFGALDAHTRILLQQELLRVWEVTKKTVILVTHSVDEAVFLADTIAIMSSKPGIIAEPIQVDIPRPRSRALPEFGTLTEHILKKLSPSPSRSPQNT